MLSKSTIKYPIGIQSFDEIIREGYLYIDKTSLAHRLVNERKYIFLSRPRRFGKSLLLSTIEAYFRGRKELFKGLAMENLESRWETFPVFRIDLTGRKYDSEKDVERGLAATLERWEHEYGLPSADYDIGDRFYNLIIRAFERSGKRVVILVDEYDKPIIDAIEENEVQDKIRKRLQGFYSVIKKADEYVRFAMVTGVGKFAQLSIFSGFNNLKDISLDSRYCDICGITENEMRKYFTASVKIFASTRSLSEEEVWERLKAHYDGYHFCEDCPDIYNPFSVLNALDECKISNFWFRTATPGFLIKLFKKNKYPLMKLDRPMRSEDQLADITDNSRDIVPLLFQSGYLTIKQWDERRQQYILDFPNKEVYSGFWRSLVESFFPATYLSEGLDLFSFYENLAYGNVESFMLRLKSLIATTTSEHKHLREEHFQNVMAVIFRMLGINVQTEIHSSHGRCDMVVKCGNFIYIFEFKLDGSASEALAQIRDKGYIDPYLADSRTKILIGAVFSSETRNLSDWIIEKEP